MSFNQIVITKDAGDCYCSIIYEKEGGIPERKPLSSDNSVGIDLGIEKFATLSDGTVIENPLFINKVEKRIKKLHREVSRKHKGSNNRRKAIVKLQRNYRNLRNMRRDFLDKVSTAIAKQYDTIIMEHLNIQGMQQNHHIAKSITDASF
ncbi:MAG: RNA-guided endonuclease InsQ/TnpB family protein, partial [Thermoplasmata archaeon]